MRVPLAEAATEQEEVDHYEILGLPSGEEERMALSYFDVKRAFRSKASSVKPAMTGRRGDPDAQSRFRQLRASFDAVNGEIYRRNSLAMRDLARLSREREVAWIVERQRMRELGIVPPPRASPYHRYRDLLHRFVPVPGGRSYLLSERSGTVGEEVRAASRVSYLLRERGGTVGGEAGAASPGPGMRN